jgi:hypothetical protein
LPFPVTGFDLYLSLRGLFKWEKSVFLRMVSKSALLLILVGLNLAIYGQHAVGLALDLNNDKVSIEDSGNELRATPRLNVAPVLLYKYTFPKGFYLGSGLSLKHFPESVGFGSSYFSATGQLVAQVPLTAGQNIFLLKNKIYLSPLLGGAFNAMLFYNQNLGSSGKIGTKTDSLVFSCRTIDSRQYYFTLHAGLQMGFYLNRSISVFLFSRYTFGFDPISRQYITYRRNQEPIQTGVQTLKATYITFLGLGVSYALGRRPEKPD